MAIKKDTLDQLLSGRDPKDVFSKDGLFDELKKALTIAAFSTAFSECCARALHGATYRSATAPAHDGLQSLQPMAERRRMGSPDGRDRQGA
jgi:hypothetical protein